MIKELCACNGLPCDGICRDSNYKRAARTIKTDDSTDDPVCSAVYLPERKKKTEPKIKRIV